MSNEEYIEQIRTVVSSPNNDLLGMARALEAIAMPDEPNLYVEAIERGYGGALDFEYQTFSQYSGEKLDEMIRTNGELHNTIHLDSMKKVVSDYDCGIAYEERFTLVAGYEYHTPNSGWRHGDSRLAVTRFSNADTLEGAIREAKA